MLFSLQTGKSLCYSHQLNKTNSTKIQAVTSPTPQPLVHTPMVLISKSYVTLFSSYQIHKIFGKFTLTLRSKFKLVQDF